MYILILLNIVVNGERASYKAPGFASKLSRTRAVLLMDIIGRYTAKKQKNYKQQNKTKQKNKNKKQKKKKKIRNNIKIKCQF